MIKINKRAFNLFCAALCVFLLGASLYFERMLAMTPCLLCLLQRIVVIGLGLLFVLGALHNPDRPSGWRLYGGSIAILSSFGLLLSGRHFWLQMYTVSDQQSSACLPGFDYLLHNFSLLQIVQLIIERAGECGEVSWQFLGLSMPAWLFLFFTFFFLVGIWLCVRADKQD